MSFVTRTIAFRSLLFVSAGASALGAVTPLHAAVSDAAETSEKVDEAAADAFDAQPAITVTASRRREEKIQDVPIALSVIGADALQRRGDYTLGQIQQQVPSLQVFSFNPRNTNVNIRGLGSTVSLTNDGLENGVGFYIDNVYYGRVGLSQFDLVDLEKIEVLRGPQGTLFGKNTTSGVVNVTSRKPSFSPEFSGEATVGNHGHYQLRASASAPIIADRLAARVSAALTDRDGFLYNTTQQTDAQDYNNASVRGQLLWTPGDYVSVRLIGDYSRQKQKFQLSIFADYHPNYLSGTRIANNFADRAARFPGYVLPVFRPFDRRGEADSHYQAEMESYGVSGELNWDLGGAALTAITAYRWWDWYPANDGDGTSLPVMTKAEQANFQRQFSQEVRLASQGNEAVNWVIGGYYFWQVVRGHGASAYGPAAALWHLPAADQSVANAALNGFEARTYSAPHTKSLATFGQLDWKLADALTLTAGLRFTHEKKSGQYRQFWAAGQDLATLPAATAAGATAIRRQFHPETSYSKAFTDNSLSGLVSLGWKVAPDVLIYGTYSRGSKSGGLNLTVLPPGVPIDVKPENVDAFELGFKSQFLNRRVTLNAALFRTAIGNYQTNITEIVQNTVNTRQYIANIPKVRSRGFEADLAFTASDRLSLNASLAYADARYITYRNAPQAPERLDLGPIQDLSGKPLPGVPKFTYTVGADFNQPVGMLGEREAELYAHADWSHRSHFNAQNNGSNSIWAEVPGYGLVNARLGLRVADGLWDVSVWARNLLNKDYFNSLSAGNTGVVTAQVGEPRTWGVTLRTRL